MQDLKEWLDDHVVPSAKALAALCALQCFELLLVGCECRHGKFRRSRGAKRKAKDSKHKHRSGDYEGTLFYARCVASALASASHCENFNLFVF